MTYERREEIFSKEVLTIKDVQELFGVDYGTASSIIRQIKFKYDCLQIQGKVHIADYCRYFDIPVGTRYLAKETSEMDVLVAKMMAK